jgi:ketosteroid isomerase-like protein
MLSTSLVAQTPAIEPVLKAELSFARLADQKGIRTAFLTWLVEDARVFTPRMTTVKAHHGRDPGDPGHLVWYPEAMGMAHSRELAWSFGPWTYAPRKGEAVLVQGHYLSIWRQQSPGHWKIEADIGIPHAEPGVPIELFAPREAAPVIGKAGPKIPDATPLLRQKEADLSAAWEQQGGLALLPELAQEARVLRPRAFPAKGREDIQKALGSDLPGATWVPDRLQVASSGELAWTCGESGPGAGSPTASFLRIWTLEAGTWKVLFDVRLPFPAPPK